MRTRVVVVDDQTVFREMLVEILAADPRYEIVGQFGNARDAIAALPQLMPGLLVLDAVLPDLPGLEVLEAIRPRQRRGISVLLVTAQEKPALVRQALSLGVQGVVMKGTPLRDLKEALTRVSSGGTYFCPTSSALLRRSAMEPAQGTRLSARERQVLQWVARGLSSKEIAAELGISEKTVANHRMHIRDKLDLRDVASFTRYAIEQGLIEPTS
jgi:DNA-binding NarL/FixJ family response regulator